MARFDDLTSGEVRIPSLAPWGLDLVPAYRIDPETGAEDLTWRHDPDPQKGWFAWRDAVSSVRQEVQQRYLDDPRFAKEEYRRCKDDPAWFITMWLNVNEPRPDDDNVRADGDFDPLKEFIPYAPQVRLIYLTVAILALPKDQHDLLISKARGFGVSYVMAAICYWWWAFRMGQLRYLSSKLEKADRAHDLDALFPKIDLFMEYAPDFAIPEGFNRGEKGRAVKHRQQAMFKNPKTKAQITAEATTGDSVRGGRATGVLLDEAAFQDHYRKTRATIGGSTRHRIDWSSESFEKGMDWWDIWHTAKIFNAKLVEQGRDPVATVIEIDWWENPYQDHAWHDRERARYESDGNLEEFATEFLRDPNQHGTHVYPTVRHCPDTDEGFDPHRHLYVGVDPGMSDMCAWVFYQTFWVDGKKRIRWLDCFERNRLPAEWYAHVLTGIMPVEGDLCFKEDYYRELEHEDIQEIMRWLQTVPSSMMTIYADPAIEAQDTGASSFRRRFILESQKITEQAGLGTRAGREVVLPYKSIYKRNNLTDRRLALRKALMYSEFRAIERVQLLKESIARVRFAEITERSVRAPGQMHDRYYHKAAACEYAMVYDDLLLTEDDLKPKTLSSPLRLRKGSTPAHRQPRPTRRPSFEPLEVGV